MRRITLKSSSGTENEEEEEDLMRPSMTMSHDDDELSSPNLSRKINMEETKLTVRDILTH